MVVSGEITLGDEEALRCQAKKDQDNWDSRFGYDAKRVKGLVDFQLYCDDLAAQTNSLPPLMQLFWSKPRLWWKIMFSSFTMHQYRLVKNCTLKLLCVFVTFRLRVRWLGFVLLHGLL